MFPEKGFFGDHLPMKNGQQWSQKGYCMTAQSGHQNKREIYYFKLVLGIVGVCLTIFLLKVDPKSRPKNRQNNRPTNGPKNYQTA